VRSGPSLEWDEMAVRMPLANNDWARTALRIARMRFSAPRVQPLPKRGRCASCGRRSVFIIGANRSLSRRIAAWPYREPVAIALATRENYFCVWCGRNFRMRFVASIARPAIEQADVYEPAAFGVFSRRTRLCARSYVDSEYFDGARPGQVVGGRRHEDLTRLTFADETYDVVITSEVLEHVAEPWRAFEEIRRVLRRDGRHIFSVPLIVGEATASRRSMPPVYHADPLRRQGSLVHTDFGDDLPKLLAPLGFQTTVHAYPREQPLAYVFESVAV
jgi:methyltransferase family protein